MYFLHKNYKSLKKSDKLTTFSYFTNKHWGITSDRAMIQCSETLFQLYYENNIYKYSIQQLEKKNSFKLSAVNILKRKEWR